MSKSNDIKLFLRIYIMINYLYWNDFGWIHMCPNLYWWNVSCISSVYWLAYTCLLWYLTPQNLVNHHIYSIYLLIWWIRYQVKMAQPLKFSIENFTWTHLVPTNPTNNKIVCFYWLFLSIAQLTKLVDVLCISVYHILRSIKIQPFASVCISSIKRSKYF